MEKKMMMLVIQSLCIHQHPTDMRRVIRRRLSPNDVRRSWGIIFIRSTLGNEHDSEQGLKTAMIMATVVLHTVAGSSVSV